MSTIWVRGASQIFVAPCFLLKKTNTNFKGFGCFTCSFLKRNKNENSDITIYHFWKMLFSEVEKRLPIFSFLWGYDAEGDDRLTVADAIHYARGEFGFEATGRGWVELPRLVRWRWMKPTKRWYSNHPGFQVLCSNHQLSISCEKMVIGRRFQRCCFAACLACCGPLKLNSLGSLVWNSMNSRKSWSPPRNAEWT